MIKISKRTKEISLTKAKKSIPFIIKKGEIISKKDTKKVTTMRV